MAVHFTGDRIQTTSPPTAELQGCTIEEALEKGWRVQRDGDLGLADDAELPTATLLKALTLLPERIWITDATGQRRLYGGQELVEGHPTVGDWKRSVHPDDRPKVEQALISARHSDTDVEYRQNDRWLWGRARPLADEDGVVRWLVGLTLDITETNHAIQKLIDSDRRARILLENDPDAVCVLDKRGRVLDVNGPSAGLTGYPAEILVGMNLSQLLPSGEILMRPKWAVATDSGQPFEMRLLRRDGTVVPVEARVVRSGDQRVCYVRDLSTEKRREANRRQQRAESQRRETLESVGRLAGGIAHDFNNMLSVILNRAELLPKTDEAEAILDAATRASALTRQLLVFSRRNEVAIEVIQVDDLVEELARLLNRVLGEHIRLVVETGGSGAVSMARSELENALVNLATNARDAMPDGGTLTVRTSAVQTDEGEVCQIEVQDTGTGMSAEVAIHAFEPFFTTKALAVGTGLGLATTYGTVTRAGGSIDLQSAVGQGTTITMRLPAVDLEPSETDEPVLEWPSNPKHARILVVEDEEMVREVVQTMLERLGHEVTTASSAEDALEQKASFELLLTDVIMPGMSGRGLAEEMRRRNPDLKVVFMSGYSADHLERLDFTSWFLQKPFTLPRMAQTVAEALESP